MLTGIVLCENERSMFKGALVKSVAKTERRTLLFLLAYVSTSGGAAGTVSAYWR